MVISRSDARKRRKEGDTLEDSLQSSPKRTKVHAQRKFAQGSSNVSSPALTPVKDKDKVKSNGAVLSPELISSKRPKTEDFLTFLCFRGTPILPPQLDFFNVATVQDQDEEQCSSGIDYSASRPSNLVTQKFQKFIGMEQTAVPGVVKKTEKIDNEAKKKPTTSVQALRKKYQEQRLAKQKASTLSILAQKVKGKNMVRTRSSALREESHPTDLRCFQSKSHLVKKPVGKDHNITKKLKPMKCTPLRRLSVRGQPKLLRELESPAIRRGGLRSSGQLPSGNDGLKPEKPLNHRLSPKEQYDKTKVKMFVSSLSDFSSDDDQPLVKKTRPLEQIKLSSKQQLARKMVRRIVKSSRKIHPHMITRSRQQLQNETCHFHPHRLHLHIQKQSQQQQLQQALLQQHQNQQQHQQYLHQLPQQQQQQQQQQQEEQQQQSQLQQQPRSQQLQQVVLRYPNRPSRKTKEAAALYMELLGKKLISRGPEADEDTFSVDSFPELPNTKRNERELETKSKGAKEPRYQLPQGSHEFRQHHVLKKENSVSKKSMCIKKEVQVKKECLQKKDNLQRKTYVKSELINKSKIEKKRNSEENKEKTQKRKEIVKLKSRLVKRSLRFAKDDSGETKQDRIQKKNVKCDMVYGKGKTKLDENTKPIAKDQFGVYNFEKKMKTSVVGHSLRSRKTQNSIQIGGNEAEELCESTKSSCLRRSLRKSSRDAVQSPKSSSQIKTCENDTLKPRRSCNVVGHLLKKPVVKTHKINLYSIEDKFSDSDEEPLRKIALKSNTSKKFDVQEERHGETTSSKKSNPRESKNMSLMCNNMKEKSKLISKVTRASAFCTNDNTIKVKEEEGSVNVYKILKNKLFRYSNVALSCDRKSKQLVKEEPLSVAQVKHLKKKQNSEANVRGNSIENIKDIGKGSKKLDVEIKNKKSVFGTTKAQSSKIHSLKERCVQKNKKKKEKRDAKSSSIDHFSRTSLKQKKKLVCAASSKYKAEVSVLNKFNSSKNPENAFLSYGSSTTLSCYQLGELNCAENDDTQHMKQNVQSNDNSDVFVKNSLPRKGKLEGPEKKSSSAIHVHPMRKCLVGIESEFRKISFSNGLQKKGLNLSKKGAESRSSETA